MITNGRRNSANARAFHSCFGWPRHCAVHCFVLAVSTSIFVTCMILSIYLTYKSNMDKIVVVLIVGCSLLYILGFYGNIYSIYYCRPDNVPSVIGRSSNPINTTNSDSAQSSFRNGPPPDVTCISRVRELPRKTPPPPYEVQMSDMSRMLLPATPRTTESSTRQLEIADEARKLIQRIYEEIRTDQEVPQSLTKAQSMQQLVPRPKSSMRLQETALLSNVSHPNLVVQRQQTDAKSIPARGLSPVGLKSNQANQQKAVLHSPKNQLDLKRLATGSEGRIVDSLQQKEFSQTTHKRKLSNPSKVPRTKLSIKRKAIPEGNDTDSENKTYEEIDVVENNQNMNSSAYDSVEYFQLQSQFENPSEQASSVGSASSGLSPVERRKNRNPSLKVRRQLSELSTKKFRQLGKSPETYLDAVATCFDLTPDQWLVAWKLSRKGVSPRERAKIIGVSLHGDSYNNDN